MVKTSVYQFGAALLRGVGGEIGITLRRLFYQISGVKMGRGVIIRENVVIYRPYNLELGEGVEIGVGVIISAVEKIKIGKGVGIGPYCAIYDNDHEMPKNNNEDNLVTSPIEIGDFSWIGTHSIILRGVKIGKNVTIGAGSVVFKKVLDNEVALGNPARAIKHNSLLKNEEK